MRCTAKKTFEVAARAQALAIVQSKDNQPTLMQKSRNCLRPPASNQQRHSHHQSTQSA